VPSALVVKGRGIVHQENCALGLAEILKLFIKVSSPGPYGENLLKLPAYAGRLVLCTGGFAGTRMPCGWKGRKPTAIVAPLMVNEDQGVCRGQVSVHYLSVPLQRRG